MSDVCESSYGDVVDSSADSGVYEVDLQMMDDGELYDHNEYADELLDYSYELDKSNEKSDNLTNDNGEKVSGYADIQDEAYLKESDSYFQTGIKVVDYESYGINSDERGFDKSQPIENTTLKTGDIVCRWGNTHGHYVTTDNTRYDEVALPYNESSVEFHRYRATGDIECLKGKAAPNFDKCGGGDQIHLNDTIGKLLKENKLEEVD